MCILFFPEKIKNSYIILQYTVYTILYIYTYVYLFVFFSGIIQKWKLTVQFKRGNDDTGVYEMQIDQIIDYLI